MMSSEEGLSALSLVELEKLEKKHQGLLEKITTVKVCTLGQRLVATQVVNECTKFPFAQRIKQEEVLKMLESEKDQIQEKAVRIIANIWLSLFIFLHSCARCALIRNGMWCCCLAVTFVFATRALN
jgi:hypothetical protein